MITKNDLRIGNTILFDSQIDTVTSIYETGCDGEFKSRWYFDRLHGIPLTPEILITCGWIWNKECGSYEKYPKGDARMHLQERGNGSYTMFNYVLRAMIAERIYFLHELQNLYYALTKTDLIYQPK